MISCASTTWDCVSRSRHHLFRRCGHHLNSMSKAVPRLRTTWPRVRTRPSPCHVGGLLATGARCGRAKMRSSARARAVRRTDPAAPSMRSRTKGPTPTAEPWGSRAEEMDMRCAVLFWMIALATLQPAAADDYYQEELRIPMAAAG